MTNQPQNPQPQESVMSKIASGFSWWINSLTGKPQARRVPPMTQTPPSPAPTPPTVQNQPVGAQPAKKDDSVSQDLNALKGLVGKITQTVSQTVNQTVSPQIAKGTDASAQVTQNLVTSTSSKTIKKILVIAGVLVLLVVVGGVLMRIFRGMGGENGGGNGGNGQVLNPTATPTLFIVTPSQPSVYSQDPVVLQLEEDIEVLVREIQGTNIREDEIKPPSLDFNVTF